VLAWPLVPPWCIFFQLRSRLPVDMLGEHSAIIVGNASTTGWMLQRRGAGGQSFDGILPWLAHKTSASLLGRSDQQVFVRAGNRKIKTNRTVFARFPGSRILCRRNPRGRARNCCVNIPNPVISRPLRPFDRGCPPMPPEAYRDCRCFIVRASVDESDAYVKLGQRGRYLSHFLDLYIQTNLQTYPIGRYHTGIKSDLQPQNTRRLGSGNSWEPSPARHLAEKYFINENTVNMKLFLKFAEQRTFAPGDSGRNFGLSSRLSRCLAAPRPLRHSGHKFDRVYVERAGRSA